MLRRWICRTEDATKKVLTALAAPLPPGDLTKKELLKHAEPFFLQTGELGVGRYRYYYLTPLGLKTLGLRADALPPPGPQAIASSYAILAHCCLSGPKYRALLDKEGFQPAIERLSTAVNLLPPGSASDSLTYEPKYYFDTEGTRARLVHIVLDLGKDAAGLVDKCHGVIRKLFQRSPLLAALAGQGAFALCVLTHEDAKRKALREALQRTPVRNVHVDIDVIPLLADLVNYYEKT